MSDGLEGANPHYRPAKAALYIIATFGAVLALGVLYVGYLVFDAQGAYTGVLYVLSMVVIGSMWLLFKTGFGDYSPEIVERQSEARRLALSLVFGLVAVGSFVAMLYYMWPMLYPSTQGGGIAPDQSLIEYMGRETVYALGLFVASLALAQAVSPGFEEEAENQ